MFHALTLAGRDRDGLVAAYADRLRAAGANLLAGHGRQLGRAFALDLLLDASADPAALRAAVADLGDDPRLVAAPPAAADRGAAGLDYVAELVTEDAPGIVSKLAAALTAHGASVTSLACGTFPAPTTGVPLFEAEVHAAVPSAAAARAVRNEFAELERHYGWAVEFRPAARPVRPAAPYPPSAGDAAEAAPWAGADGPWQWGVLSTLSPDRAGIVAATAAFLAARGASIHAQAARRVGGLFASHALFRASDADAGRVRRDAVGALAEFAPVVSDAAPPPAPRADLRLLLTVHAPDEPGIVAAVTRPVAAAGASVAALSFGQYPRPDAAHGTPLFVAELTVLARDAAASRQVGAELVKLERERGWEIDFRPERRRG